MESCCFYLIISTTFSLFFSFSDFSQTQPVILDQKRNQKGSSKKREREKLQDNKYAQGYDMERKYEIKTI